MSGGQRATLRDRGDIKGRKLRDSGKYEGRGGRVSWEEDLQWWGQDGPRTHDAKGRHGTPRMSDRVGDDLYEDKD